MQGYLTFAGKDHPLTLSPDALDAAPGSVSTRATPSELMEARARDTLGANDTRTSGAITARDGDRIWVHLDGRIHDILWRDAVTFHAGTTETGGDAASRAPMPGSVIAVAVTVGDAVKAGDALLSIESMKMETVIRASRDGVVAAVHVSPGDGFDRDALLVALEEE